MSWTVSLGISGVAYLYPVYATYKALTAATRGGTTPVAYAWKEGVGASTKAKEPPTHLSELETWTMYWCVMGIMWLYNLWIEWLLRWLPFYWQIKFMFYCWLALPQTRGASSLYKTYLVPFLAEHEADIEMWSEHAKAQAMQGLRLATNAMAGILRTTFQPAPPTSPNTAPSPATETSTTSHASATLHHAGSVVHEATMRWLSNAVNVANEASKQPLVESPKKKTSRTRKNAS
ncbi:hypothetical protein Malapachy_1449 [Malassezia pachydermatis]|uniref:Protein YOP1 n=1 Tax=Malassezia pachydermatis TaxID=77020 RepID=A0A0M9VNH6_9BASI|nr:hypothetical protein Malapachy_1449 [Malassezia pachydermatis]KOS13105.1 hypothetical protein Malapachy_1449 [Malassezia pachydermatis]